MDRLREIMGSLSEITFSMECLLYVLVALEEVYELRYDYATQKNVHLIRILLDSMAENLSDRIDEIDRYIIDNREK